MVWPTLGSKTAKEQNRVSKLGLVLGLGYLHNPVYVNLHVCHNVTCIDANQDTCVRPPSHWKLVSKLI